MRQTLGVVLQNDNGAFLGVLGTSKATVSHTAAYKQFEGATPHKIVFEFNGSYDGIAAQMREKYPSAKIVLYDGTEK